MTLIALLVLVSVVVTLVAWAVTTLAGRVGPQTPGQPVPPRPNVLFWLLGAAVMGIGVVVIIGGVEAVSAAGDRPDQFAPAGARATAEATSIVVWGVVVLTIGAYLWRAARRRGWRDRLGRLMIVVGYVLFGVAMHAAVHRGVDLWNAGPGQMDQVQQDTMLVFLGWGIPAAFLIFTGTRMARERVLTTGGITTSS